MCNRAANYFLINIKKSSNITGYDITNSQKKIKSITLKEGIYLCFIDEVFMQKNIENQFCEVIYENTIIIIRHRDIINFII